MRLMATLRTAGIVIGLAFVVISAWVVLIGPAILSLMTPR
jgi:hypothetical protein